MLFTGKNEVIRHNPLLRYHKQEIVWYKERPRQYKTTLGVNDTLWLCNPKIRNCYKAEDIYTTCLIELDGIHFGDTGMMLDWIIRADREDWTHKIFFIDQAEKLFPGRGFKDKLQTEAVNTLCQMAKRDNQVLGTCSPGNSLDIIAREDATMIIMPECIYGYDDCGLSQEEHNKLGPDSTHRRRENDIVIESIIWPQENIYQDRCYQVTGMKFVQDNWFDSFASVRKNALQSTFRK